MRHLPLLSPFSPPTSRRRRRIGIGHGKEEGAKEEGPLRFRFMAQRNIECVAAVCPFSEPLCLRMRPGCQRRRPPTDDRRGPEDPRPNTAKIHLVRYCRGTGGGKKKRSIPSRPLSFPSFSLFFPSLQRAVLHSAPTRYQAPPQPFFYSPSSAAAKREKYSCFHNPFLGAGHRTEGRKEKREKNHPILDGETTQ